jgi:hypothetical protein
MDRGAVTRYRSGMRIVLSVVVLLSSARAEADDLLNVLIGPVFGIRLGGHDGPRGVFGVEGGVGVGPERINVGFEYRDDKLFGYGELDPWFLVGGTLGVGVDSDGEVHPVLGVWEGIPLKLPECELPEGEWGTAVSLSGGYRFTGVHELYVSIKAGQSQRVCFN